MLTIKLAPAVAELLGRFLAQHTPAERSDHWRRYGALNRVRVQGDWAIVSAGAGFDSEFELNFRRPSLKQRVGRIVRSTLGRSDLDKNRRAFEALWSMPPAPAESPHAIIAQHYMRMLRDHPARSYLEIGSGMGYLAAMVREAWEARITVIDLPEILPLGFLYLHTRFPQASFALPGERGPADFTYLTDGAEVPADSVDLAANTASFGEMTPPTVVHYFRLLRRVIRPGGLFFTVNREEKVMDGTPCASPNIRGRRWTATSRRDLRTCTRSPSRTTAC
jgi:hypothetical protein